MIFAQKIADDVILGGRRILRECISILRHILRKLNYYYTVVLFNFEGTIFRSDVENDIFALASIRGVAIFTYDTIYMVFFAEEMISRTFFKREIHEKYTFAKCNETPLMSSHLN